MYKVWPEITKFALLGIFSLGQRSWLIASAAETCVLTLNDVTITESSAGSLTLSTKVIASEQCRVPEKGTAVVSWSTKGSCPGMTFEYDPPQAFPAPGAGEEGIAAVVVSTQNSGDCGFRAVLECHDYSGCQTAPPDGIQDWEGTHNFNP